MPFEACSKENGALTQWSPNFFALRILLTLALVSRTGLQDVENALQLTVDTN